MIFQGLKYFLEDGKAKKFLAYPRFLLHILNEELPNLPELEDTLDLAHLNPRVFVNMKKNHSRSTFSGAETPLFLEMMGFSDVEIGAESTSSGEEENNNVEVEFDQEELHTTQDSPPRHDRIPTPVHITSSRSAERQGKNFVEEEEVFDDGADGSEGSPTIHDGDIGSIGEIDLSPPKSPINNISFFYINKRKQILLLHTSPKEVFKESSPVQENITENVSKVESTPKIHIEDPIIPQSTPRKKSIPRRTIKKQSDVIIPSKDKYRKLYESEFVKDLTDRYLERMVYLYEHGMKWEEVFAMSMNKIKEYVHEIKAKMNKEELKESHIFFLKANDHKSKRLKNMKTENLRRLVDEIKANIEKEKKIQKEKELGKCCSKGDE
ncbi:hypothetical protein L1987_43390 [Smallanthus sonchifolius]|uniref:Uncharacterized protein n=1 Tax=Smallanthus sonchifolius TaxID=185202 RepID=A0ACB9GML4_9ASTR|nr:hypothetical protein L1987_43390 [Smallanthus sonchifolius]